MTQDDEVLDNPEKKEGFSLETAQKLKDALIKLPGLIAEKEDVLYELEVVKGDLISKNKTLEFDIRRAVSEETILVDVEIKVNKTGWTKEEKAVYVPKFEKKPQNKYTNEMQREAQSLSRLANNKEYVEGNSKSDRMDKTIKKETIRLGFLKRIFRAAESLSRLD